MMLRDRYAWTGEHLPERMEQTGTLMDDVVTRGLIRRSDAGGPLMPAAGDRLLLMTGGLVLSEVGRHPTARVYVETRVRRPEARA